MFQYYCAVLLHPLSALLFVSHFLSLLICYLFGSQQIGDDTFQLEPSLLEELTADAS